MHAIHCRTTAERDVLVTYRRLMRRNGAHWFGACVSAIVEELDYGANLSPNFVERFTAHTRTLVEDATMRGGRIVLTPWGQAVRRAIEAGDTMPVLMHHIHDGQHTWCDGRPYVAIEIPPGVEFANATCVACHQSPHGAVSTVETVGA